MKERASKIARKLSTLGFSARYKGTFYMLPICCRAAELEAAKKDWKVQRVITEYAEFLGVTPFAVKARLDYARRQAGLELGVAELVRSIAREATT